VPEIVQLSSYVERRAHYHDCEDVADIFRDALAIIQRKCLSTINSIFPLADLLTLTLTIVWKPPVLVDPLVRSLIIPWIDNSQLIKAAFSDLNFHSLLNSDGRISERLSHQELNEHPNRIKIPHHEERCVAKFLFLQGNRFKVIYAELSEVHEEAAVRLATVKR
jgi:hypothetical protein